MPESINKFGLSERDMETINSLLQKFPEIKQVNIFGSRALDTYKQGSDIDLAVMNDNVTDKALNKLLSELSESALPYRVDIINYPTLSHEELKAHIQRVGQVFYKQK